MILSLFWWLTPWLLALILSGCGWYDLFNSPPMPDVPRMPNDAEMEVMTRGMLGQAPKREAPISKDGVQVVFQTGHAGNIRSVALSPNGRYIASSGQDGTVKIWDVAGGQEIRTLTGYGMLGADTLVFSPDSTRLITAEIGSGAKVIEVATGREILTAGAWMGAGVAVAANGRLAVAHEGSDTKTANNRISHVSRSLALIDLMTGLTIWMLPDSEAQSPIALSLDGNVLLTSRIDMSTPISIGSFFGFGTPSQRTMQQEVLVWDLRARKLRKSWPTTSMVEGSPGTLSPDGRWLVRQEHATQHLTLTDLESGKVVRTIPIGTSAMSGMTNGLSFSPDGKLLAFATSDGTAQLVEIPNGRVQTTLQAAAVNFSQDGKHLVLAPENAGAPLLRELATGKETRMTGGGSGVSDLVVAQQGRSLVAATEGGSAKLWDLATGQVTRSFDCPGGAGVWSTAVHDKGGMLATGCMDGSVWLWDLNSGRQVHNLLPPLPTSQFVFASVRFTPDGKQAVVAARDTMTVWDVSTGKELRRIVIPDRPTPHRLGLMAAPEAADENVPAEYRAMMKDRMSEQQTMDPATAARMKEMAQWVNTIAVHPNGQLVAVGKQYEVSLWDLKTGLQVHQLRDSGRLPRKGAAAATAATPTGTRRSGHYEVALAVVAVRLRRTVSALGHGAGSCDVG